VSEKTGREVDADDIVMGFEVSRGRYVVFDDEELEVLRPQATHAIDVTDFVSLDDIDPVYYEKTYWLAPDGKAATRAYLLLLAAMEERGRVGIGTVVMRDHQYVAAIRPLDRALAMSTMRFSDEIVGRSDVEGLPSRTKPDAKELRMALQIVDGLASEWKPSSYKDTYTEELRARIKAKDRGREVVADEAPPRVAAPDLMAALEESVKAAKGKRAHPRRSTTTRHRTARTRAA